MNRAFTKRETVLILIFAVLLIGICYFKVVLEPINDSIEEYTMEMDTEQTSLTQNAAALTKMHKMEDELEQLKASGTASAMPSYDNSEAMLSDLNSILSAATDYSLSFGSTEPMESPSYIMKRPLTLVFYASSYESARGIIDALNASANVNQISDLSMVTNDDGSVKATLNVTFFELIN